MTDTQISPRDIPVFILAGGLGSRLSEETSLRPKPLVEIGGIPILVHIMRHYYAHGFNDFVICGGYKSEEIKRYFLEYSMLHNNIEIDHRTDVNAGHAILGLNETQENWRVRVLDTGKDTMTGGRIARAIDLVGLSSDLFAVTYGDGVCDVDLNRVLEFHTSHEQIGTLLGVKNTARFGELELNESQVLSFMEKPEERQGYVNGGFFFFNSEFRQYLSSHSSCILERDPLRRLANDNQLQVFQHGGFWYAMDTLRDQIHLQKLWDDGNPPWVHSRTIQTSAIRDNNELALQ